MGCIEDKRKGGNDSKGQKAPAGIVIRLSLSMDLWCSLPPQEAVSAATDEERLVKIHNVIQQLPPPHYRSVGDELTAHANGFCNTASSVFTTKVYKVTTEL